MQFLFFISLYNNYFSGAAASTGFFLGRPLFGFSAGTSAASFFGVTSGSCSLTFLGRPLFGFSAGTSSAASFFTLLDLVGFSVFTASVSSSVFAFLGRTLFGFYTASLAAAVSFFDTASSILQNAAAVRLGR